MSAETLEFHHGKHHAAYVNTLNNLIKGTPNEEKPLEEIIKSAGQCGPCVHGLDAIATAMERLASGAADARPQLERWIEMVRGRGACRHPDGAAGFVESALDVFADEIDLHLRYGRCRASTRGVLPLPTGNRKS